MDVFFFYVSLEAPVVDYMFCPILGVFSQVSQQFVACHFLYCPNDSTFKSPSPMTRCVLEVINQKQEVINIPAYVVTIETITC